VAVDALEHRAGGAFAVSPRDMDEPQVVLGITCQFRQPERVRQPELGAEPAQVIQELDGLGVVQPLKNELHRNLLGQPSMLRPGLRIAPGHVFLASREHDLRV